MKDSVIEMSGVTKEFDSSTAVDALDLSVPRGSVYGFIGPNGAGKTTTVRMIVGHLHPTDGTVRTLGEDPWLHDEPTMCRVAYVSENMSLPRWMTPRKAVKYCAGLYPDWDSGLAGRLLSEFDLYGKGRFNTLSKGQKRSVCIVLAVCQGADLLVMDEPAAGLDPGARRRFLRRVLEVVCDGARTVFISSHILGDLERVADRIGILRHGSLKLEGELDRLKQDIQKLYLPARVEEEALSRSFSVVRHTMKDEGTEAVVRGFDEEAYRAFCREHGCAAGARHYGLNLDDIFVEITGTGTNGDKT
jgi:ABC-2 type transport system ATP-binding protein